jgi:hypothetical protein
MLGLAAVTALVVTAFVGISSAFATGIHSGSATGPLYSGTVSGVNNGSVVLTDTSFGVVLTCTGSSASGSTNTSGSGSITSLGFTGCSTGSGACSSVTSVNTPYNAVDTFVAGGNPDGHLVVSSGGSGNPGAQVSCPGLPTCTFSATSVTANVYNPGNTNHPKAGTHAEGWFNNVSLSGGLCGSATWQGVYNLTGSGGVDLWTESA